jgi:trimethylguanosine synthase
MDQGAAGHQPGSRGGPGGHSTNNYRDRQQGGGRDNSNVNATKPKSRSPTRVYSSSADFGGGGNNNNRPTRRPNKSRSPTRPDSKSQSRSPSRDSSSNHPHHHGKQQRKPLNLRPKKHHTTPPDMTVIVNRSDLWDSAAHFQPEENHTDPHHPDMHVAPYLFAPDVSKWAPVVQPNHHYPTTGALVNVVRVPHTFQKFHPPPKCHDECKDGVHRCAVIDHTIPNPHESSVVHDKYWVQRRRLFSKFDRGILLDQEGWYSVTPEIIADHVASRVAELSSSSAFRTGSNLLPDAGIVILDAFCGCGGNSIAFGKFPSNLISKVVCVDMDRARLLRAAHNASIYNIPRDKLIFVQCNAIFILQHCYRNGEFILDKPSKTPLTWLPPPVELKTYDGYPIGGLDLLPRRIDAIFMDPPWGGVDYEVLGKTGYDLQKHMKIQIGPSAGCGIPEPEPEECHEEDEDDGNVSDDFFDSFAAAPSEKSQKATSQKARKANFNKKTEGDFINGMELVKIAAEATSSRLVVYDMPRNTNKASLGKAALGAGYRGNVKLEEHYLNGRLKTVTAYLGADYSSLINDLQRSHSMD